MSDNDTVSQVRENLPDDIDKRAIELKQRAENRELTDAERQVVAEDVQQMADALRPIIREINNITRHLASNISDTLEEVTDE
jgi:hypothetical protein